MTALVASVDSRSGEKLELSSGAKVRLSAMFDAHYRFIWRSLRRLGVPEASADDAAQEVFVIATRKIEHIKTGSERSFLFGTAMRIASDARRAQSRRPKTEDDRTLSATPDPGPTLDELTDQKRARELLDRALLAMPMELRAVFVLFEIEGMTQTEIAKTVGIPRGTVTSRLRRSREAFQQLTRRAQRGAL